LLKTIEFICNCLNWEHRALEKLLPLHENKH